MSTSKTTSGTHTLLKHYARLLRHWPADPLRPVQFHTRMAQRLQARFIAPTASANPSDTVTSPISASSKPPTSPGVTSTPGSTSSARARAQETAANIQGSGKPASSDSTSAPVNEKLERVARMTPAEKERDEMSQVNALYSLLENRYSKAYPCSEKLLRPTFKESYYEDLAREMVEAPRRSWWMQKWMRWSAIVRLK